MSQKTPQNHVFIMEFPIGLWERFSDEAEEKDMSKAEIVRSLVRSWLFQQGKEKSNDKE